MIARELRRIATRTPRAAPVVIDRSWRQYKGLPIEGAAALDSGAMCSSATYTQATGRFRWTTSGAHATVIDGYREAMARWSFPLTDLFPDYDDDLDLVELYVKIITATATTARFGPACGVLSQPASGVGSASGTMVGLYTTPSYNGISLGPTSGSGQLLGYTPTALRLALRSLDAGALARRWSWLGDAVDSALAHQGSPFTNTNNPSATFSGSATPHVHLGLAHHSTTTSAGDVWEVELWYRRTRLGAATP